MEIGLIGVGKMGFNLLGNFLDNKLSVYCLDANPESLLQAKETYGVTTYTDISEFVEHKTTKRIIWLMLPAGDITNSVLAELLTLCQPGDIVIDGGNSNPKDSQGWGKKYQEKELFFFDVGTSGGVYGARNGANFMIGGNTEKFKEIEEIFSKSSQDNGYLYTGASGSGHFLKIVHNGILYGYMQSLAEGFELLEKSAFEYDLALVADSWSKTAVIRGWLIELAAKAFAEDEQLTKSSSVVSASDSTNWLIEFALENKMALPVMSTSLFTRFKSQDSENFSGKMISALRKQVGS